MRKVQTSFCIIVVAIIIILNIQSCESLNTIYYYGNVSCAFYGTKTFEDSFNSLSAHKKRTTNNINLTLVKRLDGNNVLTVAKSPVDIKDIKITRPASFVTVAVHSENARIKFGQQNSDFELVSELIQGPDAESYDVAVKVFSC